jgi:hypothetical protein
MEDFKYQSSTTDLLAFNWLPRTTPQIMVATSDGYLYQYNIDLENGGQCVLLKQFRLVSVSAP